MTVPRVRIERPTGWWEIVYGYGRLAKARAVSYKHLPDSIKRAQVANPNLTPEDAFAKTTVEERIELHAAVTLDLVRIVFAAAHDWDPGKMSADDYIDTQMPDDVGEEIASIVQKALIAAPTLTADEKKT